MEVRLGSQRILGRWGVGWLRDQSFREWFKSLKSQLHDLSKKTVNTTSKFPASKCPFRRMSCLSVVSAFEGQSFWRRQQRSVSPGYERYYGRWSCQNSTERNEHWPEAVRYICQGEIPGQNQVCHWNDKKEQTSIVPRTTGKDSKKGGTKSSVPEEWLCFVFPSVYCLPGAYPDIFWWYAKLHSNLSKLLFLLNPSDHTFDIWMILFCFSKKIMYFFILKNFSTHLRTLRIGIGTPLLAKVAMGIFTILVQSWTILHLWKSTVASDTRTDRETKTRPEVWSSEIYGEADQAKWWCSNTRWSRCRPNAVPWNGKNISRIYRQCLYPICKKAAWSSKESGRYMGRLSAGQLNWVHYQRKEG